ncbi:hypothetical protein [Noviherbaspirillum sp. Root189]|uniref:hypothetical protein n=1 Tax=Noviherbaspirillum sp. Root189 TaxID=1736487 RepID=UPI0012E3C896|nr:hypothetical protein [Noviherbaspirillum sp. Root189]
MKRWLHRRLGMGTASVPKADVPAVIPMLLHSLRDKDVSKAEPMASRVIAS